MDYIALYRKWRPQDFSSLVGQEHIRIPLTNALAKNRIAHAYLFCGPRGTGKTSTAKILAKAVNCEQGTTPNPCNICPNCTKINQGSSMDVFEIDAASNRGIDEIRELREKIRFLPVEGRKRVYIIDEVHMLTTEAFNALLKTLEEPPEHVLFILATTEAHRIPATILSRCQRYDFKRISNDDIALRIKEVAAGSKINIDDEAIQLIAVQAEGGMRDALSLLDQCFVMSSENITAETVRSLLGIAGRDKVRELILAIGNNNENKSLELLEEFLLGGKDIKQLIAEMNAYFRAIMLFKVTPDFTDIYITDDKQNLAKVSELFTHDRIIASNKRLHEAVLEFRTSIQPRITVEICFIELCQLGIKEKEEKNILHRLEKLEELLKENKNILAEKKVTELSLLGVEEKDVLDKKIEEEKKENTEDIEDIQEEKKEVNKKVPEEAPKEESVEEVRSDSVLKDEMEFEADDLWSKVLGLLLKSRKRSLHACATQGKCTEFLNDKIVISFENKFSAERMQKEDYKNIIEKILLDVSGKNIKFESNVFSEKNTNTNKKEDKKNNSKSNIVEDELPEAVKNALEVFGGEVFSMKK